VGRRGVWTLFLWVAAYLGAEAPMILPPAPSTAPLYSVERAPLDAGAELITIFRNADTESARVPLFTVLRDTLGDDDPENDRLTYVWLLSNSRPAWWQRAAAAMPFFYHRAGSRRKDGAPVPLIDVSAKHPKVWSDLGMMSLQIWTFDPAGLAVRASTRAYQGNLQNEERASFEQALAVIAAFQEQPEALGVFSSSELARLRARLLLGQRRLGGLAPEDRFTQISANDLQDVEEARGLNWEILRQAVESSGLWFDPLALGQKEANYALIGIRRSDLAKAPARTAFDSQFLRIRDPWHDPRLQNWTGYSVDDRIPLALYDLEHPRQPLLLVDFRDNLKPKKREIFQRSVTDLMKSVFGLSYLRDWYYFAPRSAHDFVAGRHGAALDPLARLRAYAKLKLELGLDRSLDPPLRLELQRQLAHLALNPLESDFEAETQVAEEHYKLLLQSAQALTAEVDRGRAAELRPALHSAGARLLFRAGAVASLGLYHHRERIDDNTLALLRLRRQAAFHQNLLQQAAASPRVEVDWDREQVLQSLQKAGKVHPELLGKLFSRTQDDGLRLACLNLLRDERNPAARRELVQLARLNPSDSRWRRLCLEYAEQKGMPASGATASGAAFVLLPH
jgi:hypothetical protein